MSYAVLVDLVMVIWYNGGNGVEFFARQSEFVRFYNEIHTSTRNGTERFELG